VFGSDATFLKMTVAKRALFRNTIFQGDAEFRHCRLGDVDFGNDAEMSAFHKLADFRGCRFDHAVFDFAVFRGPASFVQAQFGRGGASFRNVSFEGDKADFSHAVSQGPLDLNEAYAPRIHLGWRELGRAVLAEQPPAEVLNRLHKRLTDLGQSDDALEVYYHYAMRNAFAQLKRADVPLSERAWRAAELTVWGWPTGYGTRLGRIVLIALAAWGVLTVPPLLSRVAFVRLAAQPGMPPDDQSSRSLTRSRYEAIRMEDLPDGACAPATGWSRVWLACLFSFALMFRIPLRTIAYAETNARSGGHVWARYFLAVWLVGAALLALTALTLANTSPALKKLIGEVLV
jgi:hypothetical protein